MQFAGGYIWSFCLQTYIAGEFELPYYTKFLLLAAFLASYNPPRLDVRYFARSGEVRTRKKGGGTRKTRQADLGGKVNEKKY